MQNLKDLKKYILRNIDENWSTLEKVRFVYIEAGKVLQKHTEFFLTVDDKLSNGLSSRSLDKVFMGRTSSEEWNKMICKTGAEFIKDVLSFLGISSQLVETVGYQKIKGMKHHLHHYFLSVNVDGKNIFLTPAADYFNIQNGLCTLRFGSEISYLLDGKPFYKSPTGEIPHITLSREEIQKIDEKLGYTTRIVTNTRKGEKVEHLYYDDIIRRDKYAYINMLAMDTDFYLGLFPVDDSDNPIKIISDKRNNWNDIINYICEEVGHRIASIEGIKYEFYNYINRSNFNEWLMYMDCLFDKSAYKNEEYYYANPNLILNKARKLCTTIINFCNKNVNSDDKDTILKFRESYTREVTDLSTHFIDSKYVIEPINRDEYVSNTYINHKLKTILYNVFNVNSGFTEPMNRQGYSEQIEFFKKAIEMMFPELSKKNLFKRDEDFKLHPIFKRIRLFTYRNKKTNNYGVYIGITNSHTEEKNSSVIWYKYNLADNILEKTSLVNITMESSESGKYEIISSRLKNVINSVRAIEDAGNRVANKPKKTMTLK